MEANSANGEKAKLNVENLSTTDSEDETDVLEESPCGRWHKRREKVRQRDVPGIDVAYLAMDNELGVEVVWNEVHFSERKRFSAQEENIRAVFDKLIKLDHPNLIKLHSYWLDGTSEQPRVIFITEYMSSGSMSQFLKRTSQSGKALSIKAWKKWCVPILWALDYLHSFDPPIVHCNLTCNTIFIQQNGLIKIGCVTPDAIHRHVKTSKENLRNLHYMAPEYQLGHAVVPLVDIYAFGVCALEMATLGISSVGLEGSAPISRDVIDKATQTLEDPLQKDLISRCTAVDPGVRPTAHQLLFHPILFEVPSLKLLCCHALVRDIDSADSDVRIGNYDKSQVLAEIVHKDRPSVLFKQSDAVAVDLDKMVEDVRNGIYPLTAFRRRLSRHASIMNRSITPAPLSSQVNPLDDSLTSSLDESKTIEYAPENRRVVEMDAHVRRADSNLNVKNSRALFLNLKFEDNVTRQLETELSDADTPPLLVDELVRYGFVSESDRQAIGDLISHSLTTAIVDEHQAVVG